MSLLPPRPGGILPGHGLPGALVPGGVLAARLLPVVLALFAALALPGPVEAQLPSLSGYYLHAVAASEDSPLAPGGMLDVQRLRLMTGPAWGRARLDLAWETTLTLRTDRVALGRGFEGRAPAAPWLDLQGTVVDRRRVGWTHGLDRLNVALPLGERGRITAGRQTVSWATTLYFTPADPFVPFDPADPFREYRAGVDALRGVVFTGPFSEVEAVLRPAPAPRGRAPGGGESWTGLVRGQRLLRGWEISGWGGMLHDQAAAAAGTAGSLGKTGVRLEGSFRRAGGETNVRVAAGVDRLLVLGDRDLRLVAEFQHDGFGAARAEDLLATASSPPAARGELSVLGRDALLLSGSWEAHPLASVSLLTLSSVRDGSTLLSPGLTWSLADEISLRLGGYAGIGPGARSGGELPVLRSEHGATPLIGFAALNVFF